MFTHMVRTSRGGLRKLAKTEKGGAKNTTNNKYFVRLIIAYRIG